MEMEDRRFAFWIGLLLVVAAVLPTWAGYAAAGEDRVFGGLLLNPLDGNTYLAKAYQGWEGDWRFHLPYTAEPGEGAYINLYYIFIGHAARWLGLPLVLAYNLARILGAGALALAMWSFLKAELPPGRQRRVAFSIGTLALGMGWVLVPAGLVPADFWVAEAYPFLASLTNPHFPLALALILVLANPAPSMTDPARFWRDVFLALLLGIISPFGVVIAVLPWLGDELLHVLIATRRTAFDLGATLRGVNVRRAAAILVGGLPVLAYDWFAIRANPVLAGWDAQNVAISPAWWDLLLSFSPAILLVVPALRRAPRRLLGWFLLGLLLVAFQFDLQRRFMMGLYVPLAGLAAVGLDSLQPKARRGVGILVLLSLIPGTLLILLTIRAGIVTHSPLLYLQTGEREALAWIETNTGQEDLVLAAPETGLFIPAYTGRQVIYGHPFETVDGEKARAAVEAFFGQLDAAYAAAFLAEWEVEWVMFGPREAALGSLPEGLPLEPVFEDGGVHVFRVVP